MPLNDGSEVSRASLHDDPSWQTAMDWFIRIQAAPDDPHLRRARDAWLAERAAHAEAYDRVERVWHLTGHVPAAHSEIAFANRPESGDGAKPRTALGRRRVLGLAISAVAAGVAIAFLPSLSLRWQADHRTGIGETRSVSLSDGSTAHLDADSALDVRYTPSHRAVDLLRGQVFFEVSARDPRPFRVAADNTTVTVTGTAFAVHLNPHHVVVAVQSGTVGVAVGSKQVRLKPGDQVTVDRTTAAIVRTSVAPAQIASWRDGRLMVDNVTVADVVEEFRRYYPGVILLRDQRLAARRVTGVFDLHDPVAGLRAVLQPYGGHLTTITPWLLLVSGDG